MYSTAEVLKHEYLEARCMLIEVAAILDRHDRAAESEGITSTDPRLTQLQDAIDLLSERGARSSRSEDLLLLFSDPA